MHVYDAIIAGAGPAGLYAARCCERLGLDVLVLEEHKAIGKPCHCSGLISKNLDEYVTVESSFLEHEVDGAVMRSNGRELVLDKKETAAYVIDRQKFDRYLASQVRSDIKTGNALESFKVMDDKVRVVSGGKSYFSNALLGCDGSSSTVRKSMGVRPQESLAGIMAIRKEKDEGRLVEMWFEKKVTDGFIWRIPRGKTVEYGMLGRRTSLPGLKKRFNLKGALEVRGGTIPLGPPKTYFDRVLLVGDAAAQVKPWSGGGVIYSMEAARIASDTLARARDEDDHSENFMKKYESGWKHAFGSRIRSAMLARKAYNRMGNRSIGLALSSANRLGPLMSKLDMDFLVKKKGENIAADF